MIFFNETTLYKKLFLKEKIKSCISDLNLPCPNFTGEFSVFNLKLIPLQAGKSYKPKKKNMTLHKAGYSLLLTTGILVVLINCLSFYFIANPAVVYTILAVTIILYLLIVNFFRFPDRLIILDDNTILAPADGKIVVIEETEEPEYFKDRRIQVSIFMNIFNVHINWYPINGIVRYFKYHKGNFAAAYLPKSSTENERTTIVIEGNNGKTILMRQIAGAMAKRIVSYAKPGDKASQDQHAGFIKFGSRVDLFLPLDTHIDVKLGQKTTGSQTIIGTFKSSDHVDTK